MTEPFKKSEWTPTRRAVWAEVVDMDRLITHIASGGPEVVAAMHPDRPEPDYRKGLEAIPESHVAHICELWRTPVRLLTDKISPYHVNAFDVRKVHDSKNNDTFYVSEHGEVFVCDE